MYGKGLIKQLGGPTKVARDLGLTGKKGVSRVCMWQKRGIPRKYLLEHFGYFFSKRVEEQRNSDKG